MRIDLKNKKGLLAFGFFVVWQLGLSFLLWQRSGNTPPGFGDAYAYIFGIEKVIRYHNPIPAIPYIAPVGQLLYIGYNSLMGCVGIVTGQTGRQIFFESFMWGKAVLAFCLLYFLTKIIKQPAAVALILAIMGLYAGNGAIHGFYWVAPDFFMFCMFLVLAGMGFSEKLKPEYAVPAGFLYIFLHPLAIYSIAIFAGVFIVKSLAEKKVNRNFLILTGLLLLAAAIYQSLFFILPHKKDVPVNTYTENRIGDIDNPVPSLKPITVTGADILIQKNNRTISNRLPGFIPTYNSYFAWFIRFPLVLVVFGWLVARVYKNGDTDLLALFTACLGFSLAAMIDPLGYRSLIFLAPITLVVAGRGLYLVGRKAVLPLVVLTGFMAVYGVKSMQLYAKTADVTLETSGCTAFLEKQFTAGANVYFASLDGINYFLNQNLERYDIKGVNLATESGWLVSEDPAVIPAGDTDMPLKIPPTLTPAAVAYRCNGYIIMKIQPTTN
jgi:hypothetical protein